MKEIQLTQGKVALVDDEMYDYLMQWKWYVQKNNNKFYAVTSWLINGKYRTTFMHRLIINNIDIKMHTDHINGDGLDNRKINLRICTHSQNAMNRGAQVNNKTGYKGVYYDKNINKFRATITIDRINKHLGCFINSVDAARAYNVAALKIYGEFAQLNVIPKENLLNL